MNALRTPDERFAGLPDYPFAPHYVEVDDGDGGGCACTTSTRARADADRVLLMHGEPSWSFLYRKMIPVLVDAGLRCVAPDLVGFGRSDKPTERDRLHLPRHVEWMRARCSTQLDLRDITLFGQDWGGLIGLRLVGRAPRALRRVVAANTVLPTGDRTAQRRVPRLAEVLAGGRRRSTSAASSTAAARPTCRPRSSPPTTRRSPTRRTRRAPAQFPLLVPTTPRRSRVGGRTARRGRCSRVRQAVPHCVQRQRPDHRAAATAFQRDGARRAGPAAHDHRGRRPLPAGGQGRGARPRGRRLRQELTHLNNYGGTVHDSVENLGRIWTSIEALCSPLTEEQWKQPTALPGGACRTTCRISSTTSRVAGPARAGAHAGRSRPRQERNRSVERGRRRLPPAVDGRAGARRVPRGAPRLAQLRAFTDDDLARPVDTPIGPGTMADMLTLRVMDSWAHEQDIRTALGRPGHLDGPAVDQALEHFTSRFLPYVVGKRAGAPDGARAVVEIAGHEAIGVEVVDRRARRTDALPSSPTPRCGPTSPPSSRSSTAGSTRPTQGSRPRRDHRRPGLGRAIVDNLSVMV